MHKINFLTAGIPLSTKPNKNIINGLKRVKELGLDGIEIEYVNGIVVDYKYLKEVGEFASKNNLIITAHAPYYINLFTDDKNKLDRSFEYLLDTARLIDTAGGYSIVFHSAYYLGNKPHQVYQVVKKNISHILKIAYKEALKVWIRPELMGKSSQFGSLEEIIKLSKELKGNILPCIDIAHLHSRTNGKFKTYDEFCRIWEFMWKELGDDSLKNVHIHISGVIFNSSGEQKHTLLRNCTINYRQFLKSLIDFDICGVIVCESPNVEGDALLLKLLYLSM